MPKFCCFSKRPTCDLRTTARESYQVQAKCSDPLERRPTLKSIFLSHSSLDKPIARRIAESLKALGVKVWLDEAEIGVGDSLTDKIGEGLVNADFVGALLSSNSVNSKWVKKELEIAYNREIREGSVHILPILLDDCEIPTFLVGKLYADFRSSYDNGLKALRERLAGGRRIDTPHHPIIRSYEVPISSVSGDQIIGLEQSGDCVLVQWSEIRGSQYGMYVHRIEKRTLVLREAVGFELPGNPWRCYIRKHGGKIYSISVSEIEYDAIYQVWLYDIDDIAGEPELIGEFSNPYIDDVAIVGNSVVIVGLLHHTLRVDILRRGMDARSYTVPTLGADGVAAIFKEEDKHRITYLNNTCACYHELSDALEPSDAKQYFAFSNTFEDRLLIYNNCVVKTLEHYAVLAVGKRKGKARFELIEHAADRVRQSHLSYFDRFQGSRGPFKHSFALSQDTLLATWNTEEEDYRNVILSTMLFDRSTLEPLWDYQRTLTSFSNYSSGVPILYDEQFAYLAYIEEASSQFKVKLSEIDVSARKGPRARVKRWV